MANGLGPRGYRGRGGGSWRVLPTPASFRGTSVQVCGMWPFAGGSARPVIGVPIGQDIETGSTVCCDPFSWFRAGLYFSQDVGDMAGRSVVAEAMDGAGPVSELMAEMALLEAAMADPDQADQMDDIIARYGEAQGRFQELDPDRLTTGPP